MGTQKQTVGPMTGKERVLAALKREPVDRTPICNPTSVATVELMDLVDAPFPEANRQPELMARLAATGYTELGFRHNHACFHDYPRILCTRVQDSMGAERQLAHG